MRRITKGSWAAWVLGVAVLSAPALAADPTVEQIYQAANSGQLDRAQQMMDEVLKDHPDSAKAHYVQAELYAREHQVSLARQELARAEQLKPGLPDVNPRSVAELKSQLGLTARPVERADGYRREPQAHFPWGTIAILAIVVLVFWSLFRRRSTYGNYPPGGAPMAGPGPGGYGPGGYGPGGGYVGPGAGGIGSSVAGGLAGGLAAGAGLVAGEELAHHFLDGNHPGGVVPPANAEEWNDASSNNGDMGGNDFGVNDPGSWDDGGGGGDFGGGGGDFGGGGGGGDDWT
ncbi:MAG TPA: tetratricopeptide repeat protein [Steroidobacteraceae bacterium]|nr:tetratricopeptide repeat protein [Steroidobacteraceae bacterium]